MHYLISYIILIAMTLTSVQPVHAQDFVLMPKPGQMVQLSPRFIPAALKGITIHPQDPFKFDFIIDRGDKALNEVDKKEEYTKLIKYFLASLAVPDEHQWVNLSPYEKDRIVENDFGKTLMGRDLLSQDYILKQITASLIYPQDELGKKFWDKVYAKAKKEFGTTQIPINTFNKVWVMPDDALIYEKGQTAYVVKNHLKVMLEEDYLAMEKDKMSSPKVFIGDLEHSNELDARQKRSGMTSEIIKAIIIPELQKEINEGKHFAPLRQVYSGMVLAAWFKRHLKESLLSKVYADKTKLKGIDLDPKANEVIYQQYLQAYKKGVFNYIKNDVDEVTQESVPRKYFSGGTISYAMASRLGKEIAFTKVLDAAQASVISQEIARADLAQIGFNEPRPQSDRPELRLIEDGPRANWLFTGKIPAHIVTGTIASDREGLIVAMPRRHSQPLFYMPVFVDNKEVLKWTPEDVSLAEEGNYKGVSVKFTADNNKARVRLDLNKFLLNHTFNLRMSLYYGVHVPDDEKELRQAMDGLSGDEKQELQALVGGPLDELIIPQITTAREDGNFVINIKKKTFDGRNNYWLRITIPKGFDVHLDDGSVVIAPNGEQPVEFQVRALADFELLTPLKMEEIFSQEARDFMEIDSEFAKSALNFATLFYKEKLLAGSWVYFAYFGRDTLVAARLMWPALTDQAKQMIIQGILDKTNQEGAVPVNDEVSGEMFLQLEIFQKYKALKEQGKNPSLIGMFKEALATNPKRAVLAYDVLDNSFLLQGVIRRLFDDMTDNDKLKAFVNAMNDRGEQNLITILRAWEHILKLTAPYAKEPKAENLVGRVEGAGATNWRDSVYGIAYGRHSADINIALAPSSIADIRNMVKRLGGIGIDVVALSRQQGFEMLAQYVDHEGRGFDQARKAWSTSINHFTTHLSADVMRSRLAARLKLSKLPEDRKEAILAMNIGKEEAVTVREFLDGTTPQWLVKGFSFANIAYGKAVIHSDETYALLDQDLDSIQLNRILDNLFAPYPIGLWRDDLGLFIANAFFIDGEDDTFDQFDDPVGYHSHHVIWSKAMRELKLGLIRQMHYAIHTRRTADYERLEGLLTRVIAVEYKVGVLSQSEIWTWEPDGQGGIRVVAYNQSTGEENPSWPMGLWGLADGKGQPPGNPQLWSNSAAAFEFSRLRTYRMKSDYPVQIYGHLNGFPKADALQQIMALNDRIRSPYFDVHDRFNLIGDTLSGKLAERSFFIAVNESQEVIEGYIIFQMSEVDIASVMYLAVEPGHEKQHIGTQLMQKVFEYVKQKGISTVELRTPAGDNPAIRFYKELPEYIGGIILQPTIEAGGYVFFTYKFQADAATLSEQGQEISYGGIDMGAKHLNLMIKRDSQGFILPVNQQDLAQLGQIQGLEPKILAIIPASQTLLGRDLLAQ